MAVVGVLSGILMALADPYGLSLVSVEVWGLLFGVLSARALPGGPTVASPTPQAVAA